MSDETIEFETIPHEQARKMTHIDSYQGRSQKAFTHELIENIRALQPGQDLIFGLNGYPLNSFRKRCHQILFNARKRGDVPDLMRIRTAADRQRLLVVNLANEKKEVSE